MNAAEERTLLVVTVGKDIYETYLGERRHIARAESVSDATRVAVALNNEDLLAGFVDAAKHILGHFCVTGDWPELNKMGPGVRAGAEKLRALIRAAEAKS